MRIAIDAEAANASSREGFDGHKTFCHSMIGQLIEQGSEHRLDLYMKDPPAYPFLRSSRNVQSHTVCMRWRLANWMRNLFPDPWRQVMLVPDLLRGRADVYFHVAHEELPAVCPGRIVSVVHDLAFKRQEFRGTFGPAELTRLEHATDEAVRRASHLIAPSETTKRDLCDVYGVPHERVTVVHDGCRFQPEDFAVTNPDGRSETGALAALGVSRPYILFVGVIEPRKNVGRLLRAFELLKERHGIPHQLVLAGRAGWMYEEAMLPLGSLTVAARDSVVLTGYVSTETLIALYSSADVFVFPGLYEGFGLPVLEAMAANVPVAASRAGAIPEVAGDAALLFDPLDPEDISSAMISLLDSSQMREDLISRGKRRCGDFSWEAAAASVLKVIESLD